MRAGIILAGLAWLAAGVAQAQTAVVTKLDDGRYVPPYDRALDVHTGGRMQSDVVWMDKVDDPCPASKRVRKHGQWVYPPIQVCTPPADYPVATHYQTYAFGWPGVYFESRFKGDEVVLRFDDPTSDFELLLDGQPVHRFSRPGEAIFDVTGLSFAEHEVRLERLSEDLTTGGAFSGFFIPTGTLWTGVLTPPPEPHRTGTPLPPPAMRPHRVEFIGDSYLTGYGVHSPKHECTPEELHANTDTQVAWGALIARHYDADYQINATSGIGMVRNYDGSAGALMPERYASDLMSTKVNIHAYRTRMDDSILQWQPQVIVIGLGDNDFATPVKPGEKWADQAALRGDFITTYLAFLKNLRARNPHAMIILMDYGEPELIPDIQAIAAMSKARGDDRVIAWSAGTGFEQSGCDWHLSPNDHQRIAAGIEAVIDAQPDVWK